MGGGALCTQTESGMDKELTTVGKSFGEKSRSISAALDFIDEFMLKSCVVLRLA